MGSNLRLKGCPNSLPNCKHLEKTDRLYLCGWNNAIISKADLFHCTNAMCPGYEEVKR